MLTIFGRRGQQARLIWHATDRRKEIGHEARSASSCDDLWKVRVITSHLRPRLPGHNRGFYPIQKDRRCDVVSGQSSVRDLSLWWREVFQTRVVRCRSGMTTGIAVRSATSKCLASVGVPAGDSGESQRQLATDFDVLAAPSGLLRARPLSPDNSCVRNQGA